MKYVDVGTVGGRIRDARQKKNLSLQALGEAVGISANYVSVIERNEKQPSRQRLRRIAEVLQVDSSWLETGAPPKDDSPEAVLRDLAERILETDGHALRSVELMKEASRAACAMRQIQRAYNQLEISFAAMRRILGAPGETPRGADET